MKTLQTTLLFLAFLLAKSALVMLSNSTFVAALPGEKLIAAVLTLASLGFAVWDYARPIKSIRLRNAPLLRPPLPLVHKPSLKGKMLRYRSARVERNVA